MKGKTKMKRVLQQQLATQIEEIIRQQVGSAEQLGFEALLLDDLAMDSIERVELNQKLEKIFEANIPFTDLCKCMNIQDVVSLVERMIQQENG